MRVAERLRCERGISLVEVMVAAVVLITGILAALSVVTSSEKLTTRSEKLEAAAHVAERELETLQSLRWAQLTHPVPPASGPSPHTVRLNGGRYEYQVQTGGWEEVATAVGGSVSAVGTTWNDGRLRGRVHRYVTWIDDPAVTGTRNYRRLTVVVTVGGGDGFVRPVVLSTPHVQKSGV